MDKPIPFDLICREGQKISIDQLMREVYLPNGRDIIKVSGHVFRELRRLGFIQVERDARLRREFHLTRTFEVFTTSGRLLLADDDLREGRPWMGARRNGRVRWPLASDTLARRNSEPKSRGSSSWITWEGLP